MREEASAGKAGKLERLRAALERYRAAAGPAAAGHPLADRLFPLRNRAFARKVLLVSLRPSAANARLETALAGALAAARRDCCVDMVHHRKEEAADAFGKIAHAGFCLKYRGIADLKRFVQRTNYDAVIFLDLPYGEEEFLPWAWLCLRGPADGKHFLANDTVLPPGHLFAQDLARKARLLGEFSTACVLKDRAAGGWAALGKPAGGLVERFFAVDCSYFSPQSPAAGAGYIFSCGSAGRDFGALLRAYARSGMEKGLKIYTAQPPAIPAELKKKVEIIPCDHGASRMKELIAGAAFMVIPVTESRLNPCAGISSALLGMAMGKPVLTRGNRAIHEYIRDGVSGFTYGGKTEEGLAAGFRRIAAQKDKERLAMQRAARKAVLTRNDLKAFCERYSAWVLSRRGAGSRPAVAAVKQQAGAGCPEDDIRQTREKAGEEQCRS
ncbi:MAG: hypothetical protein NDI60_02870 [Elusimicrobiales bacterium]|nr:hypothetical protein [Elusimicrobiales bacterium]